MVIFELLLDVPGVLLAAPGHSGTHFYPQNLREKLRTFPRKKSARSSFPAIRQEEGFEDFLSGGVGKKFGFQRLFRLVE